MWCSFPPPLNDDQLTAALDGDADTPVLDHLARCEGCAARLAQAQLFEQALTSQLYRWDCPPSHQLGEYHLGLVSQSTDRTIVRHLEQCPLCRAELETLRVFTRETLPEPQVFTPPASAAAERPPLRRRLGELIARVVPRAPGRVLRGNSSGPIIAEATGATIVLDVQSGVDGQVALLGQIVSDEVERWLGALVELRQGGALLISTRVDDLGSFSCETSPGQVTLRITAEDGQTLVLQDVTLAA